MVACHREIRKCYKLLTSADMLLRLGGQANAGAGIFTAGCAGCGAAESDELTSLCMPKTHVSCAHHHLGFVQGTSPSAILGILSLEQSLQVE